MDEKMDFTKNDEFAAGFARSILGSIVTYHQIFKRYSLFSLYEMSKKAKHEPPIAEVSVATIDPPSASCEDISSTSDFIIGDDTPQQPKRTLEAKNASSDGEPPAKKSAPSILLGAGFKWNLQALANAADAVQTGGKSPVSALNELGVRVSYTVLQQGGPPHCPSFSVSVTVADMTFEGYGHSKREARASAARACLNALLARAGRVLPLMPTRQTDFTMDDDPSNNLFASPASLGFRRSGLGSQSGQSISLPSSTTDFTSDDDPGTSSFALPGDKNEDAFGSPLVTQSDSDLQGKRKSPKMALKSKIEPMQPPIRTPPTANALLFGGGTPATAQKSPINTLYETYPGLVFNCTYGDGSPLDSAPTAPATLNHSMRFKVVCQIKEHKFEGYGSSKKLAKLAAAQSAIGVLLGAPSSPAAVNPTALSQPLADHVARLVIEKFHEITNGDVVHSKRKVLAGIVITTNNSIQSAKVIAVTTGTKCVSGEHMSVRGRAVNDCHAEVVARRCLQRYLYAQLYEYAQSDNPRRCIPHSDIEPLPDEGYRIKSDRQVHLYVSTAPCGDARIFSPHEQPADALDKHPNRLARGQLRTKIESGEGTIPVKNSSNAAQTWDGVLQGERLLTMSCSDKVSRWCCCGLQGALLSRFLRPVYLTSLVLGSLLHATHTTRALSGRIERHISSLPPPFQLRRPLLARAASAEARTPARAPSFAVCWCATSEQAEVLNAMTGKLESGQPSLVCKQSMFARWQYLATRLPYITKVDGNPVPAPQLPDSLETLLYHDAKQMCPVYQDAKERLITAFDKAQLGRWIKRPVEQDQFPCELRDAPPEALFA